MSLATALLGLPPSTDAGAVAYRRLGAAHLKVAGAPEAVLPLSGVLTVSQSGWGLLSVPNALVRGLFDALDEPGVELPPSGPGGRLNAHVSVFREDELAALGGPAALTERGRRFRYGLGRVLTVRPAGWKGVSRVWLCSVVSKELQKLRASYGLSPIPDQGRKPFHLTFAIRRSGVLEHNDVSKGGR